MVAQIDARAFRDALGCFPTGVAVITTDFEGALVGLTCNSFGSVSLDPPLVLWSLRTGSKSLAAFRSARRFTINILGEDQNDLSARFASSQIKDKFEGVRWRRGTHGVPVLEGCMAAFECSTFAEHEAGDHVVFIGKVEQFEHLRRQDPLVFFRGAYMVVARSLREMTVRGEILRGDLDQARSLLFRTLLPLACTHGQDSDFDAMEALLKQMEGLSQPQDIAKRSETAVRFLQSIAAAAHNGALSVVADSLSSLLHHAVSVKRPLRPAPLLIPLRWRILRALRERDAEQAIAAFDAYVEEMHVLQSSNFSNEDTE